MVTPYPRQLDSAVVADGWLRTRANNTRQMFGLAWFCQFRSASSRSICAPNSRNPVCRWHLYVSSSLVTLLAPIAGTLAAIPDITIVPVVRNPMAQTTYLEAAAPRDLRRSVARTGQDLTAAAGASTRDAATTMGSQSYPARLPLSGCGADISRHSRGSNEKPWPALEARLRHAQGKMRDAVRHWYCRNARFTCGSDSPTR